MTKKHLLNSNSEKSNVLNMPLMFICMAFIMISFLIANFTGAWFASVQTKNTSTATASVSLQVWYGNSQIANNTTISLNSPQNLTIKNTSNIDVYVRAKVIINCVDSTGNILTDLNPADYATITLSNFVAVTGYDSNFLYYYDNSEVHNPVSDGFLTLSKSSSASGTSVNIVSSSNIRRGSYSIPAGVYIQVSVFAEAIQTDQTNLGLSKWSV